MMNKKVYRFYFMFLERQEKFLNRMANEGWRLVKTSSLSYEFAPCSPGEYKYKVVFIGEKSYQANQNYRAFFEDMEYDVFAKNANLNYSVGKVRWRPYGERGGQAATSPGSYNKEIMIVGKKHDNKKFEIFSENVDLANYYRSILHALSSVFVLIASLFMYAVFTKTPNIPLIIMGVSALVGLLYLIVKYMKIVHHYKQEGQTMD